MSHLFDVYYFKSVQSDQNSTEFDSESKPSLYRTITFLFLEVFVLIFSFTTNGLVLFIFLRIKTTYSNVLFASIALTDVIVTVCLIPFTIVSTINEQWPLAIMSSEKGNRLIHDITCVIDLFTGTINVIFVLLISIFRYLQMKAPFSTKETMTMRRYLYLSMIWLLAAVFSIISVLIESEAVGNHNHRHPHFYSSIQNETTVVAVGVKKKIPPKFYYETIISVIAYIIPLTAIIIVNSMLFISLIKQRKVKTKCARYRDGYLQKLKCCYMKKVFPLKEKMKKFKSVNEIDCKVPNVSVINLDRNYSSSIIDDQLKNGKHKKKEEEFNLISKFTNF
jgi:hypothetical protein